jgi:hypothetical protein
VCVCVCVMLTVWIQVHGSELHHDLDCPT